MNDDLMTLKKLEKLAKKAGINDGRVRPTINCPGFEYHMPVPSTYGGELGNLRFVPKPDGTFGLLFSPHDWLKKKLANGGFPIAVRAKPTRKTRSVLQLCRSM